MSTYPARPDKGEQTTYAYGLIDELGAEGDGGPGPRPLAVRRSGGRGDP